jgi:hypothetical protein
MFQSTCILVEVLCPVALSAADAVEATLLRTQLCSHLLDLRNNCVQLMHALPVTACAKLQVWWAAEPHLQNPLQCREILHTGPRCAVLLQLEMRSVMDVYGLLQDAGKASLRSTAFWPAASLATGMPVA